MAKRRFGTRVYHHESIPFDVEAYAASAAAIRKEINRLSYNLHKYGADETKKKQAEIRRLRVIRHELKQHVERHFEYKELQEA